VSVVDDALLGRLAARRPKDLLPILERGASLSPLLVVLAFLPGVVAAQYASLSELDAQWRLKSLELSTAPSLIEAVDTSTASRQSALKWQPPLASWLTAASVRLPWPIGSRGMELVEYLSAAGLVFAIYGLAGRLMGVRIGLIAAALAAVHAVVLRQHQQADGAALAVLTALAAFWGFFGHLWRADTLVSLDLLCGGVSLGMCLLAGGPLAFVVAGVLLVVVLGKVAPPSEPRRGPTSRGRRNGFTWSALRSLGIMIATAFAAGGWWVLMMLYSYGLAFWSGWLSGRPGAATAAAALAPAGIIEAPWWRWASECFLAARVLAPLTILGLAIVVRGLFRPRAGGSTAAMRFIAAWTSLAAVMLAEALPAGIEGSASQSIYIGMWQLFLAAACVTCSAMAIDEMARRRVPLPVFVGIAAATLLTGYVLAGGPAPDPSSPIVALIVAAGVGSAMAFLLWRTCGANEVRQRIVLAGLIAVQLLVDGGTIVSSSRRQNHDDGALGTFRRSLPTAVEPEACVLISDSSPPYRLQFTLKSVWPGAQLLVVRDWDEALKEARSETQLPKTAVVVDWSQGNSRPANPTGALWDAQPVGDPQFFGQRQLRAYVLVWEQSPAAKAAGNEPASGAESRGIEASDDHAG
jgi:hypothetical protein